MDQPVAPAISADLLTSLAKFCMNTNRWDLEHAGLVRPGEHGDADWTRFARHFDRFILRLPREKRDVLAAMINACIAQEPKRQPVSNQWTEPSPDLQSDHKGGSYDTDEASHG
jgi:hypothetical protein